MSAPVVRPGPVPAVIGLDISLKATGIASSRGWAQTFGMAEVTKMKLTDRVAALDKLTARILEMAGQPALVVVEVPAFSRAGGGAMERAALWWLVVRSILGRQIPLAAVHNNTRMRYATGKGRANKSAIVDAVARRFPRFITGGDDNLADAVILAAMGADWLGHPLASLPKTHRAALDAVTWPDREDT